MSFISSGNFSTPTELAFLSINPEAGATPPDAIINSLYLFLFFQIIHSFKIKHPTPKLTTSSSTLQK
jgi:hypothetical protein